MAKNRYRMLVSFIATVEAEDEMEAHSKSLGRFFYHKRGELENLNIQTMQRIEVPVETPAPEPTVVVVPDFVPGLKASPEIVPVTAADDIPF